jgi:hypothetical protein
MNKLCIINVNTKIEISMTTLVNPSTNKQNNKSDNTNFLREQSKNGESVYAYSSHESMKMSSTMGWYLLEKWAEELHPGADGWLLAQAGQQLEQARVSLQHLDTAVKMLEHWEISLFSRNPKILVF